MLLSALCASALWFAQDPTPTEDVREAPPVAAAALVLGLEFTEGEIELMARDIADQLRSYATLRAAQLPNGEAPTGAFTPLVPGLVLSPHAAESPVASKVAVEAPADWRERLFELSIPELGALLRSKELSATQLTQAYLAHLEAVDETLECVITLLPERALAQARQCDEELAAGRDRGPLHGIPWGAKDLLSVAGAPTTWGAAPFREQVLDADAEVVRRLDEAGAILIAKLSLGALAWGDVWFGGTTKNPWDPTQGSSGSSAGPASAVVAGGVAFAIGSETLGSIVSPSVRCGTSSIRPSFGRVSRDGAMTLSWSMDKLGPMARSLEDAWLVLEAIAGPNPQGIEADAGVVSVALGAAVGYDLKRVRVGIPAGAFQRRTAGLRIVLDELRAALEARGGQLEVVELKLPAYPVQAMLITLSAEAAAAFDGLTTSDQDDQMVRQTADAWPNVFRAARLIPAVEYLTAQRLRGGLIHELEATMASVDLVIHPPFSGGLLSMTNLTGHPTLTAPVFLEGDEKPSAISFTGRLYDEGYLVAVSQLWQEATGYHLRHPPALPASGEAEDGR